MSVEDLTKERDELLEERDEARDIVATWYDESRQRVRTQQMRLDAYAEEYPWILEVLEKRR